MVVVEKMRIIHGHDISTPYAEANGFDKNTFFKQAWHGRQRQRATRAEKLRFQALKADDQEAYMRMVKESKNERLTTLLEETNKLLANLGAAVQRQKDYKVSEGIESLKDSESDSPDFEEQSELIDSDHNEDAGDLLEGQRQYNSAIHSIQEQVIYRTLFLHRIVFLVYYPQSAGHVWFKLNSLLGDLAYFLAVYCLPVFDKSRVEIYFSPCSCYQFEDHLF